MLVLVTEPVYAIGVKANGGAEVIHSVPVGPHRPTNQVSKAVAAELSKFVR